MGDVSVTESAVTRQLQHAILQLCNEHVTYEHTLQVLRQRVPYPMRDETA